MALYRFALRSKSVARNFQVLQLQRCMSQQTQNPNPLFGRGKRKYHPEEKLAKNIPPVDETPKGRIAAKLPFKMELQAGKTYAWCTCGHSHQQPFCDGNHRRKQRELRKGYLKPLRFTVEETKEYWLCQCKQTDTPPFCDSSHKEDAVQDYRIQPTT